MNVLKTRGNWSKVETGRHINYLELLAVLFALKVFIRLDRRKLIRVYCDNTTAVTYINIMGGMIPSLDLLSTQIWQWCLDRNFFLGGGGGGGGHQLSRALWYIEKGN
jgi:hypothetical protein